MHKTCVWLLILAILSACTCGGRTECGKKRRITLLTSIHNDLNCEKLSHKGVMTYEAAKYIVEMHNNKTNNSKIDVTILDTCDSVSGAMKATMKALVWSDMDCLRPPFYFGMIGPYSALNVDAVQKITSTLNIPHIVNTNIISPYVHNLDRESDFPMIHAILGIIDTLKWKTFSLITSTYGSNEDDLQHIAKKVTMGAIARGVCVMIHDGDDADFGTHILHIGKPNEKILIMTNVTILIASEGNVKNHVNHYSTLGNIFLLQDSRNEMPDLENRIKNSKWWTSAEIGEYDAEELRDIRWLEDAIEIYVKAFDVLCAKQQCSELVNPAEWNSVLSNVIATHNAKLKTSTRKYDFLFKTQSNIFEKLADVEVRNIEAKVHWNSNRYETFRNVLMNNDDKKSGCATSVSGMTSEDESDIAKALFPGIDDHEWWTMIATVGGVGVSMFAVGIFAVYVVISNIRGPRSPKNKSNRRERDGTIRRIESDQDLQVVTRPHRPARENQRRDSSRSIRSNISDKSV
ncbi:uncharacterized protein LOC107041629 [Diachasma alloeum]|uniref:uncharacterized protein LOC107041629 n=1 Tax=Diachasma alloeum TaxID=454923 RepID=UPI0007383484|nr:uncharacterized protein LOC107041629 [Diachasma alloeum]XP_015117738.1 uncharacterized protein LOC107041629 [Diachasma alloeum]